MKTIVQISLDLINIPEALETAHLARRAGVDWLEAGTPLIIAEGMNGVRALRAEFPSDRCSRLKPAAFRLKPLLKTAAEKVLGRAEPMVTLEKERSST